MNPLRLKIVHEISLKGKATTKEISEICGDIPQATLYRHLNSLLKHGIIEVVSENKVRGILEKVYAIKSNPADYINKNPAELTKDELSELFSQFVISLLTDFHSYLAGNEKVNPVEDKIGFRSYPLYLSDDEFIEMMNEIRAIIMKRLENKASHNRKLRKFSTVTTPYKKEGVE
jgi:DNA-binding transcriptional ArsR family regulator